MATIKDQKVDDFLHNIHIYRNDRHKSAWIGLRRKKYTKTKTSARDKTNFVWRDESWKHGISFDGWRHGEPNNDVEECTVLWYKNNNAKGVWNDVRCGPEPGFFCETDIVANVLQSDQGEWPGHPKDAWSVKNALNKNKKNEKEQKDETGIFNYWLTSNGQNNKGLTIDFGFVRILNLVKVVNTHNANWRDRATKEFKVYVRY